ncbi:hypothetical protein DFO61_2370 [Ectopseudomonas oleovorans]|uniref:Uncharacterized protein n=1 Tax=Ectopseudomonas oleovorans TaxID=301 RepID=A0A397NAV9_ECTOL|nr:hypothetical protein [Pseudomonas oleovorans]RIA31645.1 hypothetical protein DFO61_2370 [Pseudomonas oleovorans]
MKHSMSAWRDDHYISLAEILLCIGKSLTDLQWYVKIHEVAPEPGAEQLEALSPAASLSIFQLLHLVTPSIQVIDGEITAKDESGKQQLLLRAVDSSSWDVETDLEHIVRALEGSYPELTHIE